MPNSILFNSIFFMLLFLKEMGCVKLSEYWQEEAQEELGHAQKIINRIYELKGTVKVPEKYNLNVGKDISGIIQNDLDLELKGKKMYQEAIACCEVEKDFYTRDFFEQIIIGEEAHVIFLQKQLDMIDRIGLENYILNQL